MVRLFGGRWGKGSKMGVENVFFFDIPYESVRYGVGDVEILIQGTELRYLGGSGVK